MKRHRQYENDLKKVKMKTQSPRDILKRSIEYEKDVFRRVREFLSTNPPFTKKARADIAPLVATDPYVKKIHDTLIGDSVDMKIDPLQVIYHIRLFMEKNKGDDLTTVITSFKELMTQATLAQYYTSIGLQIREDMIRQLDANPQDMASDIIRKLKQIKRWFSPEKPSLRSYREILALGRLLEREHDIPGIVSLYKEYRARHPTTRQWRLYDIQKRLRRPSLDTLKTTTENFRTTSDGIKKILARISMTYRTSRLTSPLFYSSELNDAFFKGLSREEKKRQKIEFESFLYDPSILEYKMSKRQIQNFITLDGFFKKDVGVSLPPVFQSLLKRDRIPPDNVADIPFYFVIHSNIPHMILIVLYQSVVYSIGYGYQGNQQVRKNLVPAWDDFIARRHLWNTGALYTPDYLFELMSPYKYNVVDMGILAPLHLKRIQSFYTTVKRIDVDVGYRDGRLYRDAIHSGGAFLLTNQVYSEVCLVARDSERPTGTMNCVGFVSWIFHERIQCDMAGLLPVNHPKDCVKLGGKFTVSHMKDFLRFYLENDVEGMISFDKRLHPES